MDKYKYHITCAIFYKSVDQNKSQNKSTEKALESLSEQGWELVSVVPMTAPYEGSINANFIFRKKIEPEVGKQPEDRLITPDL